MTERQPPGRADRIVGWLQRINGQYAAVIRWLAVGGIVYGVIAGRGDFVSAFIGLVAMTFAVGKGSRE